MQETIVFICSSCKRKNYYSTKNKKKNPDKLGFRKYCKWCKKHVTHNEAKV